MALTAGAPPAGPLPPAGPVSGAPLPAGTGPWGMAARQFRFWLTNYRRTWRGSIYTSLLNPLLFLGAMGIALGSMINHRHPASLHGVSYAAFIAPGLLASAGMETGIGESTYPVFGSVKWTKVYQAAVASPLRPADLFHGHLMFVTMRLAMNCTVFLGVAAALGTVLSPLALAAVPAAMLTGLAFTAPIEAWVITLRRDTSLSLIFRFGMIPLFLFSGIFWPVTELPAWLRPVAYATPLWHGVSLCRQLSLGQPSLGGVAVHVGYLLALTAVGVAVGNRTYRRRLYV